MLLGLGLLVGRLSLIDMVSPGANGQHGYSALLTVFAEANAGRELKLHTIAHSADLKGGPRPPEIWAGEVLSRALGVGGDAERPTLRHCAVSLPGSDQNCSGKRYFCAASY